MARAARIADRPSASSADRGLSDATDRPILVTRSMKLSQLLQGIDLKRPLIDADREIAMPCYDSRRAAPGAAFFAIRGEATDGNLFVEAAVERGAAAVVSENPRPASLGASVACTAREVKKASPRFSLARQNSLVSTQSRTPAGLGTSHGPKL